jgi:hypothetical protein
VGLPELEVRTQEGQWSPLKQADMSHLEAAVTCWNREGYKSGPRTDAVYACMRDPEQVRSGAIHCEESATDGESYRPPYKP